jgi:hypothetical protein
LVCRFFDGAAKAWYAEKLDFRVLHEWPYGEMQLAYLSPADDDDFHLEILAGPIAHPAPVLDDLAVSLDYGGYSTSAYMSTALMLCALNSRLGAWTWLANHSRSKTSADASHSFAIRGAIWSNCLRRCPALEPEDR